MRMKHWLLGTAAAIILVGCVGPLVVGILGETPLKFEDVSREEEFTPYIGRRYVLATDMLVYGVCRFFNEFFRGDNPLYWKFTIAQWICLGLIPVGGGLFIHFWRKGDNGTKA